MTKDGDEKNKVELTNTLFVNNLEIEGSIIHTMYRFFVTVNVLCSKRFGPIKKKNNKKSEI